jgi:hypothetical protein
MRAMTALLLLAGCATAGTAGDTPSRRGDSDICGGTR